MDGTWEHATCNIGFNPKAWEVMFEEVKNDNFGLDRIAIVSNCRDFGIRTCQQFFRAQCQLIKVSPFQVMRVMKLMEAIFQSAETKR